MTSIVSSLFQEFVEPLGWIIDDRIPTLTFVLSSSEYGVYLPSVTFWAAMGSACMGFGMIGLLPNAVLTYYTVIRHQTASAKSVGGRRSGQTSNIAYAINWCMCLGWLWVPNYFANMIGITNLFIRFGCLSLLPMLGFFRTTEAMYGYAPDYVCTSFQAYVSYFILPIGFERIKDNYVPTNIRKTFGILLNFVYWYIIMGLYLSAFKCLDVLPSLGLGYDSHADNFFRLSNSLNLRTWILGPLHVLILQFNLAMMFSGVMGLQSLVFRKQTIYIETNPLVNCQTIGDFWSKRWNIVIHHLLKTGMYKPLRGAFGVSNVGAMLGSFLASGLLHEWVRWCIFYTYPANYGTTSLFFANQGLVVVMEGVLLHKYKNYFTHRKWQRTALHLCLGFACTPILHWHLDPYVRSDYPLHMQFAFPMIMPTDHVS